MFESFGRAIFGLEIGERVVRSIFIPSKVAGFTGVKRVALPVEQPFKAQALEVSGWYTIGQADTLATAEAIARGHRIDHRGARTRITEQHRPGGFAYIAV